MPAASRQPLDLSTWMSQRMNRANVPHRDRADPLIAWASWHLDAAQMGWALFRGAMHDGDDNLTGHRFHTVEFAAENLIFRGVISAMDLCGGAIFRLSGQTLHTDSERTIGWWLKKDRTTTRIPKPLRDWVEVFDGNRTWELLVEVRHAFTHRYKPRSVTVGARSSVAYEVNGIQHDAQKLMSTCLDFGTRRYSAFERALARSYSLR